MDECQVPAGWWAAEITGPIKIEIARPISPLPRSLDVAVEDIWASALTSSNGRLFNGLVFSADVVTSGLICGHWTEYRRVVAQMRKPTLGTRLMVRPLAVCGVVLSPEGIVLGRRRADMTYQPCRWQTPPAGSVDPSSLSACGTIDPARQVLIEMREELGLEAEAVTIGRPLGLVQHAGSRVLDLGFEVTTPLSADAIAAAHRERGNDEYGELRVVPRSALARVVGEWGDDLAPQSRLMLAYAGLLGRSSGSG